MKKLIAFLIVLPMALLLTGCGTLVATVYQLSDGRVVQIINMSFDDDAIADMPMTERVILLNQFLNGDDSPFRVEGTVWTALSNGKVRIEDAEGESKKIIEHYKDGEVEFDYGKEIAVEAYDNGFAVQIVFDNYNSYAYFNDLTIEESKVETVRSFLFVEHTRTIPNPFKTFFENDGQRSMQLINWIQGTFGGNIQDLNLAYIHRSSTRLTGSNASEVNKTSDAWEYIFVTRAGEPIEDIVLFIRDANRATWYGLGACAAVIFMIILYGVLNFFGKRVKMKYAGNTGFGN